MSEHARPVQELPENQDPAVAYNLIEQTGERIPLEIPAAEAPKPKRGRPKKVTEADEPEVDED